MSVDVVCLGILVADVIARPVDALPARGSLAHVAEIELRGGGCALNTASVLRALGLRAAVVGKVGADAFGDYLVDLLDSRGVQHRGLVRDERTPSSASIVLVSGDGERTFLHCPAANDRLEAAEIDPDVLFDGRCLHVAGAGALAGLDGMPLAGLLAQARRRGLLTSLDTVWDASGRWRRVEACLPHLDVICPSLAEGRAIARDRAPERVAAFFRDRGVRAVALTMGPDGCYAASDDFEGHVPAPRVDAIDGTGAGDAFAAGLLAGLLTGSSFERSVCLGCAAGARAATAVGAFEAFVAGHAASRPAASA